MALDIRKKEPKFKTDQEVLKQLNLETLDLINSGDFDFTLNSLIDCLKNEFLNNLTSIMVQQIVLSEQKSDKIRLSLPLAKLIPILDKCDFLFDSTKSSSLLNVRKLI